MGNEVQVKFSEQLTDRVTEVESALPKDFNKTRFVQNCVALMNDHPELAKLNRAQVIASMLKGSYLGLDYMQGEAYLIPYGNTVQFQTSYKGECKFVKRYAVRPILDIYSKVIRKGDSFKESIVDGRPTFTFEPVPFSNEDIVGVFAVVLYKDGGMEYETMSTEEVNNTRNVYSKASNSKAWKNSWSEMARKSVLRRLCKHIECDFESVEAMKAYEEGGDLDTNVINRPVTGDVSNPFEQMPEVQTECEVIEPEQEELPPFLQGDE
jgi:recombination protein RecT